jgi:hypothetical protein
LLLAALLVQADHEVRLPCLEIGRRIVEGKMAVLTDADEGYIDL